MAVVLLLEEEEKEVESEKSKEEQKKVLDSGNSGHFQFTSFTQEKQDMNI